MVALDPPKVRRAGRWFDVRRRKLGMWAYALNRITGIGLVVYLYLHLVILSLLTLGPGGWNAFVSLVFLIHGLNGIRITLTGLNIGVRAQKSLFGMLMLIAAGALFIAALKIFGG